MRADFFFFLPIKLHFMYKIMSYQLDLERYIAYSFVSVCLGLADKSVLCFSIISNAA